MHRPFGVTLLAIAAGVAGLFQVWRIVVFLGIADFTLVGRAVSFGEPQWGQALWALALAAIWFWVAAGFWNVRAYAYQFGVFISLFTAVFGFFTILMSAGTPESEMLGWLLSIGIYLYLSYPGVRDTFQESELSRLTPEQRAAVEAAAQANAAAAQVLSGRPAVAPAPAPVTPAQPGADR
jgi:hypothetical protein